MNLTRTLDTSAAPGLVTVRKAAELIGLSEKAIRRKREEGIWREGREIVVGPDKRIYVDIDAFKKWVRGLQ
jgi:hypothetical protein